MTEKPILFSGPMVRAILDGQKTQTRRVLKPEAGYDADCIYHVGFGEDKKARVCPFGKPGDRMWVRETWGDIDADHPLVLGGRKPIEGDRLVYRANPADDYQWQTGRPGCADFVWRPSIHMPRWACRLILEVKSVRIERLQDISEEDAVAEGVRAHHYAATGDHPAMYGFITDADGSDDASGDPAHVRASGAFQKLWDSINEKRGYGWENNPWVWVIEFEKLEGRTNG